MPGQQQQPGQQLHARPVHVPAGIHAQQWIRRQWHSDGSGLQAVPRQRDLPQRHRQPLQTLLSDPHGGANPVHLHARLLFQPNRGQLPVPDLPAQLLLFGQYLHSGMPRQLHRAKGPVLVRGLQLQSRLPAESPSLHAVPARLLLPWRLCPGLCLPRLFLLPRPRLFRDPVHLSARLLCPDNHFLRRLPLRHLCAHVQHLGLPLLPTRNLHAAGFRVHPLPELRAGFLLHHTGGPHLGLLHAMRRWDLLLHPGLPLAMRQLHTGKQRCILSLPAADTLRICRAFTALAWARPTWRPPVSPAQQEPTRPRPHPSPAPPAPLAPTPRRSPPFPWPLVRTAPWAHLL